MTHTAEAIFDGEVLRFVDPLPIEANTRVLVTLETLTAHPKRPNAFLEAAQVLQLEGPEDWSSRLDHYLYGVNDDEAAWCRVGCGRGHFFPVSRSPPPNRA